MTTINEKYLHKDKDFEGRSWTTPINYQIQLKDNKVIGVFSESVYKGDSIYTSVEPTSFMFSYFTKKLENPN